MKWDGYKIREQFGVHFITFATVQWVDVFSRPCYTDIFLDSLRYCAREKGLRMHAWCLMSNHVHFIVSAEHGNLSDILRDLKKFTAVMILRKIAANPAESRKEWMLPIFRQAGEQCSKNEVFQFWQHDNHPEHIFSKPFLASKIRYIHQNPVKSQYVSRAEDYLLSSARDYEGMKGLLELEILDW